MDKVLEANAAPRPKRGPSGLDAPEAPRRASLSTVYECWRDPHTRSVVPRSIASLAAACRPYLCQAPPNCLLPPETAAESCSGLLRAGAAPLDVVPHQIRQRGCASLAPGNLLFPSLARRWPLSVVDPSTAGLQVIRTFVPAASKVGRLAVGARKSVSLSAICRRGCVSSASPPRRRRSRSRSTERHTPLHDSNMRVDRDARVRYPQPRTIPDAFL